MALVVHFDLELHQIDVKIIFLNSELDETIYMVHPSQFEMGDSKSTICQLKKFIYGLKQVFDSDILNSLKLLSHLISRQIRLTNVYITNLVEIKLCF
jgi:Reverse transcriptase (RNA-dependent DNA polymerase)